jgi:acyl dehydratase
MGRLSTSDVGVKRTSGWTQFTQAEIDNFGRDTRDVAPLHMDPVWARQHSPFETTIAYGFQTLSLLTWLNHEIFGREAHDDGGSGHAINYGLDRVRFTGPIPVNRRFRAHLTLIKLEDRLPGQQLQTFAVEIEVEGIERPALIAEWLGLWVTNDVRLSVAEAPLA